MPAPRAANSDLVAGIVELPLQTAASLSPPMLDASAGEAGSGNTDSAWIIGQRS
jgi:hypothetical protein